MSTIPRAPKKNFGQSSKKRKATDSVVDLASTPEKSPLVSTDTVMPSSRSPIVARSIADNLASVPSDQGSIKSLAFLPSFSCRRVPIKASDSAWDDAEMCSMLMKSLRLEKNKAKVGERSIEEDCEDFSSFLYKGNLIIEKWYSQLSKGSDCSISNANDEWKVKYEALLASFEADKKIAIDSIAGWRVEAHEQRARSERREAKIMEEHPDFDCDADKAEIVAEAITSIAEEDRENEDEARREKERAEIPTIPAATNEIDTSVVRSSGLFVDESLENVEL
ncbi:hypothetical protein FRX31_021375 [Thalictrum thalictroides]|uniref:Uncharacterized protein n=1 Tax=Thalictrum thalictroides TaxID=46969 RepID=A0A7J6VWR7_THATH|nr:hypothetical protein FRX31_021375 [Thalictrum thalictroides]